MSHFPLRSLLLIVLVGLLACQAPPPPPAAQAELVAAPAERAAPSDKSAGQSKQPAPTPPPANAVKDEDAKAEPNPALFDPSLARETAPERYAVTFETTAGEIIVDVRRGWAPLGADRFYNLVKIGYFDNVAFFRVISGFMAQFGIHGDPEVNRIWRPQRFEDDPVAQSNQRGTVSFATSGKNSRVNQLFINFADNSRLDGMGFAPIGRVRGMDAVDKLNAEYGEGAPAGRGPLQARFQSEGNSYLRAEFPKLDYIKRARITDEKR